MRLPDGYTRDEMLSLDLARHAQDLVFYGKTGRGKTHLATALGMLAVDKGMDVGFLPTAGLVLQLGKAKRDGNPDNLPVVPEKLRTLDHGRPWSDDQFASTRLSSNRDMSR